MKPFLLAMQLLREFLGTTLFLTCAYAVSACGAFGAMEVAAGHGLALACAAFVFGCDANPMVSLTALVVRRLPSELNIAKQVIHFILLLVVQLLATVVATATVAYGFTCPIVDAVPTIGAGYGYVSALVVELFFTAFLIIVAVSRRSGSESSDAARPLMIGLVLLSGVLTTGGISGCSVNPLRALGPSMFSGFPAQAWLYYIGPFIGAVVASIFVRFVDEFPRKKSRVVRRD